MDDHPAFMLRPNRGDPTRAWFKAALIEPERKQAAKERFMLRKIANPDVNSSTATVNKTSQSLAGVILPQDRLRGAPLSD